MPKFRSPQTIAASNGIATDSAFGAVVPPIHLSSSYAFEGFGRAGRYDYTRSGNPTRDVLADTLAKLEAGTGAVVVSSGMAAIDLVLASLEPGDFVVAPHDCYAGTRRLVNARRGEGPVEARLVDQTGGRPPAHAPARGPQ